MSKSKVHSAFALLIATAVTFSMSVGCSKQNEGERCDRMKAGDSDCEDGLICTKVAGEDRCCPPDGSPIGDSRCSRTGTGSGSGGQGNSGGQTSSGGLSNAAGEGSGGSSSGGDGSGGLSNGGGNSDAGAPAQGGAEGV